jgi:hypothetical protein
MSLAVEYNTTEIWILNIGSLKPLELPTEHFMSLAYDYQAWPRNSIARFTKAWASREFGAENGEEVGDILERYSVSRNTADSADPCRFTRPGASPSCTIRPCSRWSTTMSG